MGVFSRLSDLVVANVYALLDLAEDPERMLSQVIREMEAGLAVARRHAAVAIAAERRLARELEQHRAAAEHWQGKAGEALTAGREALARQALARKLEHEDLVRGLAVQQAAVTQTGERLRSALRALDNRLADARRRQALL